MRRTQMRATHIPAFAESCVPVSLQVNYLTYTDADFRRHLCARELRNRQGDEGQRQAAAIVAKGLPMDVPQSRRYHVRHDGEDQEWNRDQEPAGVNNDPRVRGRGDAV